MEEKWITQDWRLLTGLLPEGWEEKAKELGALSKVRKVREAGELLRLALLHAGAGHSLAQTVARGAQWGLPEISDVALYKRLKACSGWLRWMCEELALEQRGRRQWEAGSGGLRMLALDGTDIEEPGPGGSDWRLHYAIEMPGAFCVWAQLTDVHVGESLRLCPLGPGDLVAADRGYCREAQIKYALESGAHVLQRWHGTSLPLYRGKKRPFDVLGWLRGKAGREGAEVEVSTKGALPLRLCAVAVSGKAAARERAKVRERARKQGREASERSLELAGYIVLVCSLPRREHCLAKVLGLYRLRWQVELAFKRLKSLLGAGHVPKKDPSSVRAWLQAKMLVCLLIEKLLLEAEVFSPWGFLLPRQEPLG